MLNVKGKRALVTGGSLGIGAAIVRVFCSEGVETCFTYCRHDDEAHALERETGATPIRADLMEMGNAVSAAEEFVRVSASTDMLVCNAGIWTYGKMGDMEPSVWRETMAVNLDAVYAMTNVVVNAMKEQGSGVIVLIASTAARRGEAFHAHYAASKGALISLARSLAAELGPSGIRTNVVAPGWVDTPMTSDELRNPERRKAIEKCIPLGRIPGPDDIAYPVLFLVSDWARHMNGAVLDVNGGAVLVGG